MPLPQSSSSAFLGQALSGGLIDSARASEVADLVAGLADIGQHVGDLTALLDEAEQQVRKLVARMGEPSLRRTASARHIEAQGLADQLQQGRSRICRLREALHDAQQQMSALSAQYGSSSELDMMRARAQQEELRVRALEAELSERLTHDQQRLEHGEQLRRQNGLRKHWAADDPLSGLQEDASSHPVTGWQPPDALQADFEELARRAGRYVSREAAQGGQADNTDDKKATSQELADVQARLANVVRHPSMPSFKDPSDLVQWVIRQAHTDGALDIQNFAYKVHFSTRLKEAIREELQRARSHRSEHGARLKDGAMDVPFDKLELSREPLIGADGVPRVRPAKEVGTIVRVEELDTHISDLQNMLASTGEDMQISQLELQNMTQRQQQVMHVMSSLSKALHETCMAIIRKIGN